MTDANYTANYWANELDPYYPVLTDDALTVLPEKQDLMPEQTLMLAILQDAIACVKGEAKARRHEQAQLAPMALDWMLDESREDLFSFRNICETLLLDPDAIREGLQLNLNSAPAKRVA